MNTPKIDFDKFICSWLRMRKAVKSDVECGLVLEALGEQGLGVNTSNPREYSVVELPTDNEIIDPPVDNETVAAEVFFKKGKFYILAREIPLENYMKGRVYFSNEDNYIVDDTATPQYWNAHIAKQYFRLCTNTNCFSDELKDLNSFETKLFGMLYEGSELSHDKCLEFAKNHGKELLATANKMLINEMPKTKN